MFRVPKESLSHQQWRLSLCLIAAVVSGWVSYQWAGTTYNPYSDFAQLWHGARALLRGESPYAVVGPGRAFDWSHPLLYPLPAVLVAVPFAVVPLRLADALFVGLGAFALAWVVTQHRLGHPQWWVFASRAFVISVGTSQWGPLLMGATTTPVLNFLFACKPTIGAALWCAYPSRRGLLVGVGFVGFSLLVWPSWPWEYLQGIHTATHMSALIQHVSVGGPLILLALLKWRRPEARLLVALACVPQSTFFYEALPLFLVVRRWYEGVALCLLNLIGVLHPVPPREASYDAYAYAFGDHMVLWMYLPCLVAILCRPNESPQMAGRESGDGSTMTPAGTTGGYIAVTTNYRR